jgi:hypothetical protein
MEYCSPSDLLKIDFVKERFKTPQQIGYFIKNFKDKIKFYYTRRGVRIPKENFISFIKHLEKFPSN